MEPSANTCTQNSEVFSPRTNSGTAEAASALTFEGVGSFIGVSFSQLPPIP